MVKLGSYVLVGEPTGCVGAFDGKRPLSFYVENQKVVVLGGGQTCHLSWILITLWSFKWCFIFYHHMFSLQHYLVEDKQDWGINFYFTNLAFQLNLFFYWRGQIGINYWVNLQLELLECHHIVGLHSSYLYFYDYVFSCKMLVYINPIFDMSHSL